MQANEMYEKQYLIQKYCTSRLVDDGNVCKGWLGNIWHSVDEWNSFSVTGIPNDSCIFSLLHSHRHFFHQDKRLFCPVGPVQRTQRLSGCRH